MCGLAVFIIIFLVKAISDCLEGKKTNELFRVEYL
nr:MAG TPA: hypothetical protein [Caudoviricetes sp.]